MCNYEMPTSFHETKMTAPHLKLHPSILAYVPDRNYPINTVCESVHKSLSETPNNYQDLSSQVWLVSL